jgi:membrane associated rhomboid family serine protease
VVRLTFRYYPQPHSPETDLLEKKLLKLSVLLPFIFVVMFWLVKVSETVLGISLVKYGVHPRHINGLIGILTSPFIHGDYGHLVGNSASFLFLATALFFFYRKLAYPIFLINYFLAGALLWLIGRESYHIGASGVVYGLAAFLFVSGVLRSDVRLLTISLVVTFLYGSLIWGLFPIDPKISWDGHWAGALSGVMLALVFKKQGPPRRKFIWEDEPDDDDEVDENSDSFEFDKELHTDDSNK